MDPVIHTKLLAFKQEHDLPHLSNDDTFEAFVGFCVLKEFYEREFNPDTFRIGGGNDYSVDVFAVLINGELYRDATDVQIAVDAAVWFEADIVLIQTKTSTRFEAAVISHLASNISHLIRASSLEFPASPEVQNIKSCIEIIYGNLAKQPRGLPRLHVRYATTASDVNPECKTRAADAESQLAATDRLSSASFRCLSAFEILELHRRATTAITVEFSMPSPAVSPPMPGVIASVFGLVRARELVDNVLTDRSGSGLIRKSLFHENVRDFQGYEKNEVNRDIRRTLRDDLRRARFGVLNNGITIVTRRMRSADNRVNMTDFQIVNGGQTCHVIFDQRAHLTDDVYVSVRVVHSEDDDVIGGIIAATNRQTAITEDDLLSREDFHKSLEDYFASRPEQQRIYYERRSKQYAELKVAQKTRVISRTSLARAYLAMFSSPTGAENYRDAAGNKDSGVFNKAHAREFYYAAAVAHYRTEWLLRNRRLPPKMRQFRYHLMAAISWRVIGNARPQKQADIEKAVGEMASVLWDEGAAERLCIQLASQVEQIAASPGFREMPAAELLRDTAFSRQLQNSVMKRGR